MVGVYFDNKLCESFIGKENDIASDFLVEVIDEILKKYKITEIIYANGPGSFLGIKVAYVVLKTISVCTKCSMFAVSGFELNDKKPIKANKLLSFVLDDAGKITLKKAESGEFNLPENLLNLNKNNDILPNYIIDAI